MFLRLSGNLFGVWNGRIESEILPVKFYLSGQSDLSFLYWTNTSYLRSEKKYWNFNLRWLITPLVDIVIINWWSCKYFIFIWVIRLYYFHKLLIDILKSFTRKILLLFFNWSFDHILDFNYNFKTSFLFRTTKRLVFVFNL